MGDGSAAQAILGGLEDELGDLEELYRDAHRHPELSMQEQRAAGLASKSAVVTIGAVQAGTGDERVRHTGPSSASEDFGSFGSEWSVPNVFWFVGGFDPEVRTTAAREGKLNELPSNHNPRFAPILHPTLETGVQSLVAASCAWLSL